MDRTLVSLVQEGVSFTVNEEISLFISAVFSGMILVAVYDFFRIFRRIQQHGQLWVAIEDICYWIFCAVFLFGIVLKENGGVFRSFFVVGVIIGSLIYYYGISRYFVGITSKIINKILDIVKKVLNFILKPFKKMVIFLAKRTKGILQKAHENVKLQKKTIEK